MKEIILTFNPDGTVTKETKGFTGKSCVKDTAFIEEALGKPGKRRLKSEYYEQEAEQKQRLKIR